MSNPSNQRLVVVLALTAWGSGVGCGPMIELEEGSESGGLDGTTTTSPPGTTTLPPPGTTTLPPPGTTAPPPDDTTGEPDDTGSIFLMIPDGGPPGYPCDIFQQECPDGEKCMPWANDGGNNWNATRCSPLIDDPDAVGEPCTAVASPLSGVDSCDFGSMCWNVDPDTLEGTCVAFCTGSEVHPMCENPDTWCLMNGDSTLAVCLPGCDPLLQDCADGEACYPARGSFACFLDDSGDMGSVGDPCEFINACDPGLFCAQAELVPGCPAIGCCTSFCDLGDPMPPCLPGQECTPWFEDNSPPPSFESLGACALLM